MIRLIGISASSTERFSSSKRIPRLYKSLVVLLSLIIALPAYAGVKHSGSVGLGVGAIYGVQGLSFDYDIHENTSVFVGLGKAPAVGVQYYFRAKSVFWRPKISLFYGNVTHGYLFRHVDDKLEEKVRWWSGPSLEIGQSFQSQQNRRFSMDLSVSIPLWIPKDEREQWIEEKVAEGYRKDDGVDFGAISMVFNVGFAFSFLLGTWILGYLGRAVFADRAYI